jgi:hypothetical protein
MKVILTESQFKRLFLNEQGGISGIGNISNELPISDRKAPDFKKLASEIDIHTVLDIASILSLAIPIAGPFISVGLELVNGILYINEGDNLSGGLSIALSLIPGGLLLRRSLKSKKILSKVDNLLIKHPKILKSKNPNEVINLINNKLGTEGEKNMDLIINYLNTIKKIPVKELEMFNTLTKSNPKLFSEFIKNEKILKQYLSSNDNNFYKAFKSYISKYAKKEMIVTSSIYVGMLAGIKTIQEGISRYIKHLQEIGVKPENIKKIEKEIVLSYNESYNTVKNETEKIQKKSVVTISNVDKILILQDTIKIIGIGVDTIKDKYKITEYEVYEKNLDELISISDSLENITKLDK